MSRLNRILLFAAAAILAAFVGYSQTLAHKTWSPAQLATWFPLAVFAMRITGSIGAMVFSALMQYPLLIAGFAVGIQRWSFRNVLIVLCSSYVVTIAIALALL